MQAAIATPETDEDRPPGGVHIHEQRLDLARRLVDVLALPGGQMNDHERSFTADMLNELLDHVPVDLKIETAERLARVMMPPPNLLRRLLLEPVEVAGPLIDAFKQIPDPLLVAAAEVSPGHRDRITRQVGLDPFVVDALLRHGDAALALRLLNRQDIVINCRRIDDLVKLSATEPTLRAPLLERIELEPRHAFQMFWWVDEAGRTEIVRRFAVDRTVIQTALKSLYAQVFPDPDPDLLVKRVLTLCDRRHRPRGRDGEAVSMDVVQRMLIAARANPTPDMCAATGLLAGVTMETARRVLFDPKGEPFAILSKSIGVSRRDFADILEKSALIRKSDAIGPVLDDPGNDRAIAVFDMMARDYARTILRYWDWRPEIKGDPVPV